jgi:2-hexadecenal reductase
MDVVVGIDLGTTRCVVAHDTGGGTPVIIDAEGDGPWTPSVVHFDGGRWEVGAEAALMAAVDPDSVVIGIKREMGEATTLFFGGEEYGPEVISGIILRHLAEVAEAELGPGRVRAVITVPAYFGAAEREATRAAARIAGLDCLGLLAEPVAASLSVVGELQEGETRLVYDLGGGTFDVTVIEQRGDGPASVVAVDGNCHLGGLDWDERLELLVLERWVEIAADPEAEDDTDFLEQIRGRAEEMKISLSRCAEASVRLRRHGHHASVTVTRKQFEQSTADLLDETIEVAHRLLTTAAVGRVESPSEAVLVGGSSRMPQVARAVAQRLGMRTVLRDPDTCVAKGAAVLARDLGGRCHRLLARSVLTVAPRQIGLVLRDSCAPGGAEIVVPVIGANEALPVHKRRISMTTLAYEQGRAMVTVVEQLGPVAQPEREFHRDVALLEISGLKGSQGGEVVLEVSMDADSIPHFAAFQDGRTLTVRARREGGGAPDRLERLTRRISGSALVPVTQAQEWLPCDAQRARPLTQWPVGAYYEELTKAFGGVVVLCLDVSGSMLCNLTQAQEGCLAFLDSARKEGYAAGAILWDHTVVDSAAPTSDGATARALINAATINGGTNVCPALRRAGEFLEECRGDLVIAIFGDGDLGDAQQAETIASALVDKGIRIITCGLGLDSARSLAQISTEGRLMPRTTDVNRLSEGIASMAAGLRER